mgnify:CR=1 FL=1
MIAETVAILGLLFGTAATVYVAALVTLLFGATVWGRSA